jgi:hypothetical protein
MDLLNQLYGGGAAAPNLMKAVLAGDTTGMQTVDQLTSGAALKTESLNNIVKLLENTINDLQLWNMIPKKNIIQNVHQYTQTVSYGEEFGMNFAEGESPVETTSKHRRKSILTSSMGVVGQLTHHAMLVQQIDGKDPYTREVEYKTIQLLTKINQALSTDNSDFDNNKFDGLFKQHYNGISDVFAAENGTGWGLDAYANDSSTFDARGKALSDDLVQDATHAVTNDRFGRADCIISAPAVFKNYVKRFHESKRTNVGAPSAISGATMGQSVNNIMTQFGPLAIKNDIFFDRSVEKKYNTGVSGTVDRPSSPEIDVTTPIAVQTDAATKFGDGAGDYFYAVTAANGFGESAMVLLNTLAQAVSTAQSVQLKWAAGAGNTATSFRVYRTKKDVAVYTTAIYYKILEITPAELTAGYSGGDALTARDLNRRLPGTHRAIVTSRGTDMWEYLQLTGGLQKVDFAVTTLAKRFAVVNYGTPVLYMPGKQVVIENLGSDIT